jgi:hypothetical protein
MVNLPTEEEINFLFYALDLEEERKKTPHPSDTELLSWFPEAKNIILIEIKEWREKRIFLAEQIRELLFRIKENATDDFSAQFCRDCIKHFHIPGLIEIDKHLSRLHRQNNIINNRKPRDNLITRDQIDQARAVPIQTLLPGPFKKIGRNSVCLCPLHNEKTPSFTIFTKTNTYKCFGCQQGGNSIKLMRSLYNCDFKEAVKNLLNIC